MTRDLNPEPYPKIYLYRRIVQAKLFIDAHYAEPIDLDNISGEAFFSKFHFIRLFGKIYRKTPHQYLTWVRIENARLLLAAGSPVSEACSQVGFESLSSFAGLFKKMTGISPSAYQKQQRRRRDEIAARPLQFIPNCFAETNGWTKTAIFKK